MLDFDKMNGLIPAIIQDNDTRKVLMLGFMNKEAYEKTVETGKVTFFSRTKNRLWTKGEESGNFLNVVSIKADCDNDTLLIQVNPVGPVCHTGTDTCWGEKNEEPVMFLKLLQDFIDNRIMFRRVFRPMDDRPVGRGIPFEFLQKSIQMAVRIEFDITGQFAQAFPFGKRMAHFIPFGTNHPEGFVVPGFLLAVLDEAGSCF